MKILFLFSAKDAFSAKKPLKTQEEIQFGISYISAYLKKNGYQTNLFVATRDTKYRDINFVLEKYSPELICCTSVFSEYNFILNIARYIKEKYPEIFLLAGGPHVSLNPQECINDCFDAICVGEGEYAVNELVKCLEERKKPLGIRNIWIKNGEKIEKNPAMPFLQDLDSLPFPDRDMWQPWIGTKNTFYPVLLGRGCPFLCTYCCNHALRKVSEGNYVRIRSVGDILSEINQIASDLPQIKEIYFEVETFGVNMNWAIELCSGLEGLNSKQLEPFSFGTNLRLTPNIDLEKLFIAMERSNFKFINIGLESGSERVRREILNRHYSNKDVINAVNLARQHKIKVNFQILIGLPGEAVSDFEETIAVTRTCQPDRYLLNIFFPYPGTELYNVVKRGGLLKKPINNDCERTRVTLGYPEFTKKQIRSNYIWFEYKVYKGKKPLYVMMANIFISKAKSSPITYTFFRILFKNSFWRAINTKLKNAIFKNSGHF